MNKSIYNSVGTIIDWHVAGLERFSKNKEASWNTVHFQIISYPIFLIKFSVKIVYEFHWYKSDFYVFRFMKPNLIHYEYFLTSYFNIRITDLSIILYPKTLSTHDRNASRLLISISKPISTDTCVSSTIFLNT